MYWKTDWRMKVKHCFLLLVTNKSPKLEFWLQPGPVHLSSCNDLKPQKINYEYHAAVSGGPDGYRLGGAGLGYGEKYHRYVGNNYVISIKSLVFLPTLTYLKVSLLRLG